MRRCEKEGHPEPENNQPKRPDHPGRHLLDALEPVVAAAHNANSEEGDVKGDSVVPLVHRAKIVPPRVARGNGHAIEDTA